MSFDENKIPDEDSLFLRVHKTNIVGNKIIPGAYTIKGDGGLSTDWSQYSTPHQSLARSKNPNDNGIVKFNVREVRAIELKVVHRPLEDNVAHSEIIGIPANNPNKTKTRLLLDQIAQWEIPYPR